MTLCRLEKKTSKQINNKAEKRNEKSRSKIDNSDNVCILLRKVSLYVVAAEFYFIEDGMHEQQNEIRAAPQVMKTKTMRQDVYRIC